MQALRRINNNVALCRDGSGRELIAMGKGVGFGSFPRELALSEIERTFYDTDEKYRQLVAELPEDVLAFAARIVEIAGNELPYALSPNAAFTLADHISFAIQRSEQGIRFSNPLMAPIREFYPEEYRLGMECLAAIRQRCHADLSDDEGGFIALHIVNAELNTTMSVVNDVTRFVDGCVQVVEYFYNCHFDRDALDFSRFTVHLRFFAQRVFQGKQEQENDTHDEVFRALIARNCSEHYKCACCIAEYVRNTWHKELSDEELVFLTIHLKRIRMGK